MKTIALIPAYNEESTIGDVIKAASRFVHEILVIKDGSTDSTTNIARTAGAAVIDNRNLGKTIPHGHDEAIKRGADIVVEIDVDGQYDPEEIPKLIQPFLKNRADLILGKRFENLKYLKLWLKNRATWHFHVCFGASQAWI